jgi:RNA polymerase sigma factor (sigma-70 family)
VLVNTAAGRWRRRKRYAELTAGQRPPEPEPDPATTVVLHDAVWRALATLPPRTRAVLVLRYFEDYSEAQVAATLGCGVGSVKSQASRGLARLRTQLDAEDLTIAARTGLPGRNA